MKLVIKNNSYSKYKENIARSTFNKYAKKILGKRNFNKISRVEIFLQRNWNYKTNPFRDAPFLNMWDEENKTIRLSIASNWCSSDYRKNTIAYGVKHELVHVKDIMNENLIPETPKKNEKFRVWWLENDEYILYNKHMPEWLNDKLWSNTIPYRSWLDALSAYYPWERNACLINRRYK